MKVCPKCNSTYSDETLNYCLTDGVPLVDEELTGENLSSDWQDADTVFDANLKIHSTASHITSPNPASETTPKLKVNTGSFSTTEENKSRSYLFPLIGVLATLGVIGGVFGWVYNNSSKTQNTSSIQNITENQGSNTKRIAVQLTAEQENQVKKEVATLLEQWRLSIEKRDADANVKFYVDTLENYYKESGIDKNHVRADRLRAIDRYQIIGLEIDHLTISPESEESATAIFDKTWNFKNPNKISTGSVQQEMNFIKQNGKWLINGEKDVKVYFINNRENPTANSNSSINSSPTNSANSSPTQNSSNQ